MYPLLSVHQARACACWMGDIQIQPVTRNMNTGCSNKHVHVRVNERALTRAQATDTLEGPIAHKRANIIVTLRKAGMPELRSIIVEHIGCVHVRLRRYRNANISLSASIG